MLILDTTTRSLEIDLNAAVATNQLPFVASYVDMAKGSIEVVANSQNNGTSNDTTAVTMVAAPGSNRTRHLKYLSIKNSDTAAVLLWIQLNDNTTLREIWKGTLAVGDTLVYLDSLGFNVVDSSGGIKSSLVNTMSTLTLTSTLTMSGTAANIAIGSNYISYGGTDAGFSLDASNNATLSGSLSISFVGNFLASSGATTSSRYGAITNTGGTIYWGVDNSTGGDIVGTSTAYAAVFGTAGATGLHLATNNVARLTITSGGDVTLSGTLTTIGGATFHTTSSALTDGAGVGAGTILTAPAAGNPTKWIGINDNGTTRYIPAW